MLCACTLVVVASALHRLDVYVDRFERTGRIDAYYLGGLSADAAPALARLPSGERTATGLVCPAGDDGVAGFNAGRAAARRALNC